MITRNLNEKTFQIAQTHIIYYPINFVKYLELLRDLILMNIMRFYIKLIYVLVLMKYTKIFIFI